MFAVIEHEETVAPTQICRQRVDCVGLAWASEMERARNRPWQRDGIGHPAQIYQPDVTRGSGLLCASDLEREARLAATSGSHQRDEPGPAKQPFDLPAFDFPADKARQRNGQTALHGHG